MGPFGRLDGGRPDQKSVSGVGNECDSSEGLEGHQHRSPRHFWHLSAHFSLWIHFHSVYVYFEIVADFESKLKISTPTSNFIMFFCRFLKLLGFLSLTECGKRPDNLKSKRKNS